MQVTICVVSSKQSGVNSMSTGKITTAIATGPAKNEPIPVQIATMLKVIMMYDKFDKIFSRWSTHKKEDRDVLVLCLKPNSTVDATLIYTVCMMYPFRIYGPIIINDTMHIEFLNYGHDVLANTTDFDATAWNVQFPIARQQKRRHDATTGDNSSADRNAAAINTDQLRSTLLEAIANTNTARIHVEKTGTGIDRQGPWISFELSSCDRLNLDFMGKFQTSANNSSIKVQWWMAIAKREISAQHALFFEISLCIYECWHVCFGALLRLYCCINTHTHAHTRDRAFLSRPARCTL